jgi:tetratricopeptide (TPR) repeat protein
MADSFMKASVQHDRSNPDRKRNYAEFLIKGDEYDKGLQVMASVFAQDPARASNDIAFLVDSGFADDDIRRNLPDRIWPFLAFAAYMDQKGDHNQAAALYRQALTYIKNEEHLRPDYFYRVSGFFSKQKRYAEGLDVILQAIKIFPADAGLRLRAGNLYRDMGLTHRALEQYQQVLTIAPENSQARKHIAELQHDVDKKFEL